MNALALLAAPLSLLLQVLPHAHLWLVEQTVLDERDHQ